MAAAITGICCANGSTWTVAGPLAPGRFGGVVGLGCPPSGAGCDAVGFDMPNAGEAGWGVPSFPKAIPGMIWTELGETACGEPDLGEPPPLPGVPLPGPPLPRRWKASAIICLISLMAMGYFGSLPDRLKSRDSMNFACPLLASSASIMPFPFASIDFRNSSVRACRWAISSGERVRLSRPPPRFPSPRRPWASAALTLSTRLSTTNSFPTILMATTRPRTIWHNGVNDYHSTWNRFRITKKSDTFPSGRGLL